MMASRSLLLASTMFSGVVAVAFGHSACAQSSRGLVLAQAAPANPADAKKKPLAKPQPPKSSAPAAAPHPPQKPAPQAARPPSPAGLPPPHAVEKVEKPAPMMHPAETAPSVPQRPVGKTGSAVTEKRGKPELHGRPPQPVQRRAATTPTGKPATAATEKHATEVPGKPKLSEHPSATKPGGKPEPKMHPAQTTQPPAAQHPVGKPGLAGPEKRAAPQVPGKPLPGSSPTASAPSSQTAPQSGLPHERGRPAAATAPATKQNAGNAPAAKPGPPPAAVVRRAPPPPGNPAAVPPPTQVINKGQFLAPKGQASPAGINQVRAERHEEHVGNQLIIREPDRTIVQEGNRTFIRHSEVDRFAVGARNVQVERRGNETVSVVMRPNGVRIIDYTDEDGRLLRRVRRDPDGREIVIIDNGFAGAQMGDVFLNLPPPVIHIPSDRYIVDADRADEAAMFDVLVAPPVERVDRRYTLDQVRYNEPLRALMPRLDLEVNFGTGSWQLTPDQVDRLSAIAEALNRAIERDPREVFLVEGYTDAVGSDVDNLSLSDRRAESVAVALTEQFHVPAENLATQGYGEQFLKVQTSGAERANRRVAIQRITPLMDPDAVSQR